MAYNSEMAIEPADPDRMDTVRELFREYQRSLGVDLCFQSFEQELAGLPGDYAPPRGRLYLAVEEDGLAGCVALRPIDHNRCEMKRLFVRPNYQGRGIGRALADAIIRDAREVGYQELLLDTLPSMTTAIAMYRRMGFHEIAPYRHNPVPGALYMSLDLLHR